MKESQTDVTSLPVVKRSFDPVPKTRVLGRQDAIRQWILFIPLATAMAGVATTQLDESYVEFLRPLYFIGALLITVAMLHQRQLYRQNQQLSESLQLANGHLDTLHRLQFDLNRSLEISQVSQSVLNHVMDTLHAPSGVLWLRSQFDVDSTMRPELQQESVSTANIPRGEKWHVAAVRGWDEPERHELLLQWSRAIEADSSNSEAHLGVKNSSKRSLWLGETGSARQVSTSAIAIPVRWKDEIIGILLVACWNETMREEDAALLREVALVTGPALENALLYQRTLTRADFDGLTNLLNHSAIQERLAQELARTQRARVYNPNAHFAIAVFDLTDFKLFNDTYGHAMGDEVLRTVSRTLRQTFRISDIVARYGGDEFLVVLPEADSKGAMTIATRVIEAIKSQVVITSEDMHIVIRATCGIAVYPEDGETGADLFQSADERLYEAKQLGQQIIPYVRIEHTEPKLGMASLWGHFGMLDALITSIDNRDHYTRSHSEQTMCYAILVARELGHSVETLDSVRMSGLLYDVGKIAVPDAILRKPGLLSFEEKQLMQQHCRFGVMMVPDIAHREAILDAIRSHHEAYDGSGYPEQLQGEDIPWIGRLLAVSDCFAAMTTDRPYRKSLCSAEALNELKNSRGKQFDPHIVDAFVRVFDDVIQDKSTLQDKLQDALKLCEELTSPKAAA